MHIVNGHLCKSNPFDAANFGLKAKGAIEKLHGKIAVKVSGVKGRPKNVDIWIPPKQVGLRFLFLPGKNIQKSNFLGFM